MALVPPANGLGANLWDMGAQGSDHTRQPGSPVNVIIPPEGVIYASFGVTCVDVLGEMFVKTTDVSLATGWCQVACQPPGPPIG